MTASEAIEYLTAHLECESRRSRIEGCNNNCNECELCYLQGTTKQHLEGIKIAIQALEEVQKYRAIGTPEECREAVEKQAAKKPIFDYNLSDTLSKFHCECGNTIKVSHDIGIMNNNNAPNYCSKCGCRFDWSDEE